MALPFPDSPELKALRISYQAREIYRLLYESQDRPITMREIRDALPELGSQEQLDRRRRELNRYFVIDKTSQGADTRYMLARVKPRSPEADLGISERDRATVLRHGRCAMCGRTPLEDGVKLQVDHKIPKEWGGRHRRTRESAAVVRGMQPRQREEEPVRQLRCGATFSTSSRAHRATTRKTGRRGFASFGCSAGRLRHDASARTAVPGTYYQLVHAEPWPEGNIRQAIRRREHQRGY